MRRRHKVEQFLAKQGKTGSAICLEGTAFLAAYQETLAIAGEQQALILETLRQGLLAFLPRALTQTRGATA